ncbi:MAG TPA: AI-2E family transporter [Chthoniobacterales bacterium]|nr:AI-2E family transporter [Chthoniobacterales bacterium]
MTKPARFSFAVLAATLVLAGFLHLGGPLLALLFSYFALSKLGGFIRNKWLALGVFLLVLAGLAYASVHFTRAAITALPKIAENSIPAATAWAQAREIELPFTDFESLKNVAMDALKEQVHYLRNFANFARNATTLIVFVIIGVVAAVSLFFNSQLDLFPESHAVRHNLYSICCEEISARFREFYHSFATVMGAQMTISCINTVLTSIFVLAVGLPYAPVIIGITFLCGLVPIVGNVISNTVIVFVGFIVSPRVALGALIFLILIHKLEYFLNSKIIGDRIRNPIWLTLFGLIVGEKLMGIPGMILSPVILNYLRVELSKVEVDPPVAASEQMTIEPGDRPS